LRKEIVEEPLCSKTPTEGNKPSTNWWRQPSQGWKMEMTKFNSVLYQVDVLEPPTNWASQNSVITCSWQLVDVCLYACMSKALVHSHLVSIHMEG
jgi:hypothetical protein